MWMPPPSSTIRSGDIVDVIVPQRAASAVPREETAS
jgi:hypothetical protein